MCKGMNTVVEFANNLVPDETAHDMPSNQDLQSWPTSLLCLFCMVTLLRNPKDSFLMMLTIFGCRSIAFWTLYLTFAKNR